MTAKPKPGDASAFQEEIRATVNRASKENASNTPDFILAQYLESCLDAFDRATRQRDSWWAVRKHIPAPAPKRRKR